MTTKNYTPESFAKEFEADVMAHAERMMLGFARKLKVEAHEFAVAMTPVESPDTDMERMAGRWGTRIERRDTVPSSPTTGLEQIKLGTSFGVLNDDKGAAAIDAGRKRNHYKARSGRQAFSRMGGSPQAPRGVSKPTAEHVISQSERLGAEAIAEADEKFGAK